jgi:hypothetical protein
LRCGTSVQMLKQLELVMQHRAVINVQHLPLQALSIKTIGWSILAMKSEIEITWISHAVLRSVTATIVLM